MRPFAQSAQVTSRGCSRLLERVLTGVDADTILVVATTLTQAPNDKQQVQPILNALQAQAAKLGAATTLIADTGYCRENNVKVCEEAELVPLIAVARQDHHPHWSERFTDEGRCHANGGDDAPFASQRQDLT